jgi:hypothetical protein
MNGPSSAGIPLLKPQSVNVSNQQIQHGITSFFLDSQLNYIISIPHFWVTFKHVKKVVSFSSFWFNKSFQFGKKCFVVLRSNLIGCDFLSYAVA